MSLYIIGLGLNDEKDISLKGLEIIKKCDKVYIEDYTSVLSCPIERLERLYDKKLIAANREIIENNPENTILKDARTGDAALLVVGDPMSATTHIDLYMRAMRNGVLTKIIHNASILTAVGITGLQLYKFGKVSSIPFNNENIEVPYDNLKVNLKNDMHSLFLLDLDPINKKFLSIADAIRYLLKIEIKRGENIFKDNSMCIGCQKIGSLDQKIKYGKASEILKYGFLHYPQCLIVPSKLHFMEEEALGMWK